MSATDAKEWPRAAKDHQDYVAALLETAARESEQTERGMKEAQSPYATLHGERARCLRVAISVLEWGRTANFAALGAGAYNPRMDPPIEDVITAAEETLPAARTTAPDLPALPAAAGEGDSALGADALVVGSRPVKEGGRVPLKTGDVVRHRRTGQQGVVTLLQKSRADLAEPDIFWMNNKGPFRIRDFVRPGYE